MTRVTSLTAVAALVVDRRAVNFASVDIGNNDLITARPLMVSAFSIAKPTEIHLLDPGHFALDEKTTRSRASFLRSWPNIPSD